MRSRRRGQHHRRAQRRPSTASQSIDRSRFLARAAQESPGLRIVFWPMPDYPIHSLPGGGL